MASNGMIAPKTSFSGFLLGRWRLALAVIFVLALSGALILVGLNNRSNVPNGGEAELSANILPKAPDNTPLPAVEPLVLYASHPDEARQLNAEIPFSTTAACR